MRVRLGLTVGEPRTPSGGAKLTAAPAGRGETARAPKELPLKAAALAGDEEGITAGDAGRRPMPLPLPLPAPAEDMARAANALAVLEGDTDGDTGRTFTTGEMPLPELAPAPSAPLILVGGVAVAGAGRGESGAAAGLDGAGGGAGGPVGCKRF